MRPLLCLPVAALLASGCAPSPAAGPARADDPGTVVVPATPAPPALRLGPAPGPGASLQEQVRAELEQDAVRTAGVPLPTRSRCEAPLDAQRTVDCTVDYAGVQVPYRVTVASSGGRLSYRYATASGVLVREAVLRAAGSVPGLAARRDPRCTVGSRLLLVTLGEPSGVTCSHTTASGQRVVEDVVLGRSGPRLRPRG